MERSLAILAALPREIQPLVKGTDRDASLKGSGIALYRPERAVVVAAGMGRDRVALAFQAAQQSGRLTTVISVGFAGACTAEVQPGSLHEASLVIDASTGERFRTEYPDEGAVLTSTDTIASTAEKARLHATYRATLVDMEAATVGRLAQAHGLKFRAIKAVSDGNDFDLSWLSPFRDPRGQFRTAAFVLQTAVQPWQWGAARTLGRNSQRALETLTRRLKLVLAETA